jgi:hypothetical protein
MTIDDRGGGGGGGVWGRCVAGDGVWRGRGLGVSSKASYTERLYR